MDRGDQVRGHQAAVKETRGKFHNLRSANSPAGWCTRHFNRGGRGALAAIAHDHNKEAGIADDLRSAGLGPSQRSVGLNLADKTFGAGARGVPTFAKRRSHRPDDFLQVRCGRAPSPATGTAPARLRRAFCGASCQIEQEPKRSYWIARNFPKTFSGAGRWRDHNFDQLRPIERSNQARRGPPGRARAT